MSSESESNLSLYESDEVIAKYSAALSRNRQMNVPESRFVDRFRIAGSRVLVVGCGAGRLPANLSLLGCTVVGIDRSEAMVRAAKEIYPNDAFPRCTFLKLDIPAPMAISQQVFDVVIFPMNGIDYSLTGDERIEILHFMSEHVKRGGLVALVANNLRGFLLSPRIASHQRSIAGFFRDREIFDNNRNIGGGRIVRQTTSRFVAEVQASTDLKFIDRIADARGLFDNVIERSKLAADWYFPNFLFVFEKP